MRTCWRVPKQVVMTGLKDPCLSHDALSAYRRQLTDGDLQVTALSHCTNVAVNCVGLFAVSNGVGLQTREVQIHKT